MCAWLASIYPFMFVWFRLQKVQGLQVHQGSLVLTWTPADLKKVNTPDFATHEFNLLFWVVSNVLYVVHIQLENLAARNLWTRKITPSQFNRFVSSCKAIWLFIVLSDHNIQLIDDALGARWDDKWWSWPQCWVHGQRQCYDTSIWMCPWCTTS